MSTLMQLLYWARRGWTAPGLIPENCQAVDDYKNKRIPEQEMWRIINRNIGLNLELPDISIRRWETKPAKGDTVRKGDRNGVVLYRTDEEYQVKFFDTGDIEGISIDEFYGNATSRGGRSHWTLEDI